ncbi:hypothetical protein FB451DRAFT_1412874 [Mycena latifolia]|nr:hypothetical protein FB451DRAFT_1412874 [Mycena latifolia]
MARADAPVHSRRRVSNAPPRSYPPSSGAFELVAACAAPPQPQADGSVPSSPPAWLFTVYWSYAHRPRARPPARIEDAWILNPSYRTCTPPPPSRWDVRFRGVVLVRSWCTPLLDGLTALRVAVITLHDSPKQTDLSGDAQNPLCSAFYFPHATPDAFPALVRYLEGYRHHCTVSPSLLPSLAASLRQLELELEFGRGAPGGVLSHRHPDALAVWALVTASASAPVGWARTLLPARPPARLRIKLRARRRTKALRSQTNEMRRCAPDVGTGQPSYIRVPRTLHVRA